LIVTGMGKMGCIARKAAGTFSSTGTPAIFLDPADAIHGGLGIVRKGDVVLALSNSGETSELLELLPFIVRQKLPIIAITGGATSSLARFHPGGNLGRKLLLKVSDLMHHGDAVPIVGDDCSLGEAVKMISQKNMGTVLVRGDNGCLGGILTDGDVRRIFESTADSQANPLGNPAKTFMTSDPTVAKADELAATALNKMESLQITVLPVLDSKQKIVGIIHMHDLIRGGLA